jgi:hypothetical protein
MSVKVFPDVKVKINKKASENSYFRDAILSPAKDASDYIAQMMVPSIEKNEKLIGATIDEYVSRARDDAEELNSPFPFNEKDFLDAMVKYYAKERLVYAVVEKSDEKNGIEKIMDNYKEIQNFLKNNSEEYDPEKVSRTIFVPSDTMTRIAWKFAYSKKNLGHMVNSVEQKF